MICEFAISFIVFFLLPLYFIKVLALKNRIYTLQEFESERKNIESEGREIHYYEELEPSTRKLPVIYEVKETESGTDKQRYFPYSLVILHKRTSLCDKTKKDNMLYDSVLEPHNADPVVDPEEVAPKKPKLDFEAFRERLLARAEQAKVTPSKPWFRLDRNINNVSRWPYLEDVEKIHQTTQTEQCYVCLEKSNKTFSNQQIIFSISCCCNRSAHAECLCQPCHEPCKLDYTRRHSSFSRKKLNLTLKSRALTSMGFMVPQNIDGDRNWNNTFEEICDKAKLEEKENFKRREFEKPKSQEV